MRSRFKSVLVREMMSSVMHPGIAMAIVHCMTFGNMGLELMQEAGMGKFWESSK